MLGSLANSAATRTVTYASNELAGLTTQMGPYQRPLIEEDEVGDHQSHQRPSHRNKGPFHHIKR